MGISRGVENYVRIFMMFDLISFIDINVVKVLLNAEELILLDFWKLKGEFF